MKNAKISRRSFLLGLAACSAAGILTACKGDDTPASSASTSPEAPASSVSELEPIGLFTVEDFPKLDGSTACIPLMAQMMADTTGIDLEVAQSGISVSTTAYAWENFGLYPDEEYTARMLVVYEAPDYVKEELKEANAQLEQKPIGRDALVFIVNENNPVKSLTRQQLKDIYAGKITNWKEVGGEDLAIVPFQRGEDSGSQTLFRKLLIQGGELMDPPTELHRPDVLPARPASAGRGRRDPFQRHHRQRKLPAVQRVLCRSPCGRCRRQPGTPALRLAGYRRRTGLHQKIRLCSGGTRHCSEQCRLIF